MGKKEQVEYSNNARISSMTSFKLQRERKIERGRKEGRKENDKGCE